MEIEKKVAFLKGLAEGLDIHKNEKEGKVISGILDVLEEMAEAITDIFESQIELEDQVDEIEEAVADIQEEIDIDYEDDFDDEMLELSCPDCGAKIIVEPELFENSNEEHIVCPDCGKLFDLDYDEEE